MPTYTLAYDHFSGKLLACLPDGEDIESAILQAQQAAQGLEPDAVHVERGLTLTNTPQEGVVIYSETEPGQLRDEHGHSYTYAVRT